ncbi:retrovirus-related pol polyprotein from transposon tnt 1-94 [Lasius niger]|uniref:Retrovirus-related pol polyprotein from transposon tnt 1-94 n=1 Tax=Lasius niger TaxID=67767 RepID=A0A0J7KUH3_LASNI|nr:retrovirus-related pol polyprotein from transposon tnt 1-94 [Lasius niger]
MHQMDVTTAYLHGDLEEEIYVKPPKEIPNQSGKIWRLRKAMYGLKQSGRAWNKRLSHDLKEMELIQSKANPCIYYRKTKSFLLVLDIYVDDMFVLTNDDAMMDAVKARLSEQFRMTDLGEARHFLGIRISKNEATGELYLDQETYLRKVLERYGMSDCKPVSTPCDPNQKLTKKQMPMDSAEAKEMRNVPYREAIGSLLYASQGARPDIAYAVNLVSRFCQEPRRIHWTAVKRILRYLRGMLTVKLIYSKGGNPRIEGFSDSV